MDTEHVSNLYKSFQDFLDNHQYSRAGIIGYEKIFGRNFVSTGGLTTTEEICKRLNLKTGAKVLDVGCGIGGSAFHMAQTYGAHVLGIDLSRNMIEIAMERSKETQVEHVSFEVTDATTVDYPENSFDVIYSRDTILHIKDKLSLFKSFSKWLKPGGTLLITDYCCTDGTWSEEYSSYVKSRGYFVISTQTYQKVLEEAGFKIVCAEDRTNQFLEVLKSELDRLKNLKESFLQDGLDDNQYQSIADGWNSKIRRCMNGDQRWGLFLTQN